MGACRHEGCPADAPDPREAVIGTLRSLGFHSPPPEEIPDLYEITGYAPYSCSRAQRPDSTEDDWEWTRVFTEHGVTAFEAVERLAGHALNHGKAGPEYGNLHCFRRKLDLGEAVTPVLSIETAAEYDFSD